MTGQKTLTQIANIIGELDKETPQILGEALLKLGLGQGYCHTNRWYKVEAQFYIVDNTNIRLDGISLVEIKK